MLAPLAYARRTVGPDGIRYRTLGSNRALQFTEIKRAYIVTSVNRFAPHGVASFGIQPNEGKPLNINLRNVPVAAAAALLAALERHGGAPAVPDTWAAQRMAREIQALARPGPRRVR